MLTPPPFPLPIPSRPRVAVGLMAGAIAALTLTASVAMAANPATGFASGPALPAPQILAGRQAGPAHDAGSEVTHDVTHDAPSLTDAGQGLPTVTAAAASARHSGMPASVVDLVDMQAAIEARLAMAPPAPALRAVWAKVAGVYHDGFMAPRWWTDDGWSPSARAAMARLAAAREDALELPVPVPAALTDESPESIAAQDVALTTAVVAYARQASGDRIDPLRISRLITAKPSLPEPADVMAAVAGAGNHANEVLGAFNPTHAGYRALRDKLAELRRSATPLAARIPAGPALRIGMRDPRVKLVRLRFGLDIAAPQSAEDILYNTRVAEAVAGFQRENGLPPSGVLTPRTVALLSGGEPRRLENEIIANMERWRWLPRDLGSDRIEVDVPGFTASLIRDGQVVHKTRVVVGKPENPTPIFSNAMKFIIVNPSWYIPPSILKKEILPKLAADPGYLARLGYEMTVRKGQISVRQPPGERNALGHVKFMFPNDHAVYLHDTPSRGLFASTRRAFSHGCVRVDDPMALASAILRGPWTEKRLDSLVGKGERTLFLPTPLPIHIEYFTAAVGDDGRLTFREDLYGYDAAVIRALALKD